MTTIVKKCSLIALSTALALSMPLGGQAVLSPEIEEVFSGRTQSNEHISHLLEKYEEYYEKLVGDGDETRLDRVRLWRGGFRSFAEDSGLKFEETQGDIQIVNGQVVQPDFKIRLSRNFFIDMATAYKEKITALELDVEAHRAAQQKFSKTPQVAEAHQEELNALLEKVRLAKEEQAFFEDKGKLGNQESDQFEYTKEKGLVASLKWMTQGFLYAKDQTPFVFAVLPKHESVAKRLADLLKAHDPRPKVSAEAPPIVTGTSQTSTDNVPVVPLSSLGTDSAAGNDDLPPLEYPTMDSPAAQGVIDKALAQGGGDSVNKEHAPKPPKKSMWGKRSEGSGSTTGKS